MVRTKESASRMVLGSAIGPQHGRALLRPVHAGRAQEAFLEGPRRACELPLHKHQHSAEGDGRNGPQRGPQYNNPRRLRLGVRRRRREPSVKVPEQPARHDGRRAAEQHLPAADQHLPARPRHQHLVEGAENGRVGLPALLLRAGRRRGGRRRHPRRPRPELPTGPGRAHVADVAGVDAGRTPNLTSSPILVLLEALHAGVGAALRVPAIFLAGGRTHGEACILHLLLHVVSAASRLRGRWREPQGGRRDHRHPGRAKTQWCARPRRLLALAVPWVDT
mmetsp:Transcript_172916/g.554461  ORF Transcript_172916/g.554461 Transcript_172916/m.554461 type:complete len:278 (+) Transcript_172916:70-903(+)